MSNPRNHGIVIGRLVRDPKVFVNKDNSRKVLMTVAVKRNYGNGDADFVSLEAFVPASKENLGVFDHIHKADTVAVEYHITTSSYTDGNGETQYRTILTVENVEIIVSKGE